MATAVLAGVLAHRCGVVRAVVIAQESMPVGATEQLVLYVVLVLILAVVLGVVGLRAGRFDWLARYISRPLSPGAGTIFIWPFVWIHLLVFDRLFLWHGRLARLDPPPDVGAADA